MNIHMRVPSGLKNKCYENEICLLGHISHAGSFLRQGPKIREGCQWCLLCCPEMPKYPGGETALRTFLAENLKYPEEAKVKKLSGKVYVSFILDETGKVTNAKVVKGVDPLLDKEALRVVNLLPQWEPGKDEGKPVKVSYTIPVKFSLD